MNQPNLRHAFPKTLFLVVMTALIALMSLPAGPAGAQQSADNGPAQQSQTEQSSDAAVENTERDNETGLPAQLLDPTIAESEFELRLIPLTRSELEALAAIWLDVVRQKSEQVIVQQIAVARADGSRENDARADLASLVEERRSLFDKYSMVISAWDKKGGDPALIAEYQAYRSSVIVEETRTSDYQTLYAEAWRWLVDRDGGVQLALNLAIVLGALIGLLIVARIIRRFARRWIGHVPNLSKLLQAFLVTLVYWLVLTFGLMVVLSALGIDITPVFALIGGASFIMAFAFQDTLGNLASGLMIMINRPFDEGDYVDVGGVAGTVKSVSIVATTVVTPDNQIIVIPNKNVWGNVITNVTASKTRRVDLVFGISYEDSIAAALRVMEETTQAHPLVLKEPEPVIKVHELADSSVNFVCRPWTRTSDYWTVYWDLTQQIKENFDAAGISIPYPQQDVHVKADHAPQLLPAMTEK